MSASHFKELLNVRPPFSTPHTSDRLRTQTAYPTRW